MPEPVRVVFVVAAVAGGIATHVRALAHDLESLDVHVTVIAPSRSLRIMSLGDSVVAVAAPVGQSTPWAWWSVRRRLRRVATDGVVVHAQGLRAAAAPGVLDSVPLVETWHNGPLGGPVRRRLHAALERRVARRAAVVLAASEDLAVRARSAHAGDVRVVLVGSGLPRAAGLTREQVRASLRVDPTVPIVLAVGRLHPQKRLDVLIAAAAGWPHVGEGARRVLIAGDGPLRASLAAQIAETNAPVTLLGARDDAADLMAAADVVVLPSAWEARALVAQEAMDCGVPLVCTAVGGLPELVADAAVLVPVGDAGAVRDAVDRVLGDPELAARMVQRGRELAAGWPSGLALAVEHRDLYLDLRSRSGPIKC